MSSTMEQRERYESLYHATTQHLLVRNFQAAEESVLSLLKSRPRDDLEDQLSRYTDSFEDRLRGWTRPSEETIKAYKLYAFVLTSKYTEGLESTSTPTPVASYRLKSVFDEVIETYYQDSNQGQLSSSTAETRLLHLHPSILQTILLSLLKINSTHPCPYSESLPTQRRIEHPLHIARTTIERWLAELEEETIKTLSFPKRFITREKNRYQGKLPSTQTPISSTNDGAKRQEDDWAWYAISERLGSMNKSYRAVLRTYVLEVLPRFEDWDLARDMILAGLFPRVEEQEKLLKKLHTLEAQHKQLQKATQPISASTSSLSQSTSSLSSSIQSEMDKPSGPPTIRPPSSLLRPPSPSAASAQTDRTVRAVDYMKGRKEVEIDKPKTTVGEKEIGNVPDEKAESSGDMNKRDDASLVGSSRSLYQESQRFGHSAFETLRARIVRYLDTPIDQDPEQDFEPSTIVNGQRPRHRRSLSISRRQRELARLPLHQRLSRNFTFKMIMRLLSLISIIGLVLGLIRRRNRRRARTQGEAVLDGNVWQDVGQELSAFFGIVKGKIKDVIKMGTTISYV